MPCVSITASVEQAMAPAPLSLDQISRLPTELPAWRVENGKLHRDFRFVDFNAAFGFMARVALVLHVCWCTSSALGGTHCQPHCSSACQSVPSLWWQQW